MFRLLKNKKNEAGRACNIGIGAISTLVSGEFLEVGEIFLGWLRFFLQLYVPLNILDRKKNYVKKNQVIS